MTTDLVLVDTSNVNRCRCGRVLRWSDRLLGYTGTGCGCSLLSLWRQNIITRKKLEMVGFMLDHTLQELGR